MQFTVFLKNGGRTTLDVRVDDEGCYRVTAPEPELAKLDLSFEDSLDRHARQIIDAVDLHRSLHTIHNPERPRDL